MGHCCSKNLSAVDNETAARKPPHSAASPPPSADSVSGASDVTPGRHTPATNSFSTSPFPSPLPPGVAPSPAKTPGRKFRWPLPPPSPAKPIMAAIMRRQGKPQPKEGPIPEEQGESKESERQLDKSFGYSKNIAAKYELGKEVGRGHFGHTCYAKAKKGELRGQSVAVKVISKAKMTTAIAIEDVRREVKMLKALSGHKNLVKFLDAFEDSQNVYIVMELCEGGELLDRILSRGGRYTEEDAKAVLLQILNVVAFCHLQGVVHRDLKPENFLFVSKDDDAQMKVIDFGLSDFVRPDQRLNDIVGSAYYVAPEVLHRSYSVEADLWSIGVITYILLCGSRPFWARTESGIFRSVLRANPNFDDSPWPVVSPEAKDFVKRLLNKDHRKRMTAAQALTHPWLRNEKQDIPLDVFIYKQVKSYVHATPLKRAALKALSKALTEDELIYLKAQFSLLEPKNGYVSLDNFRAALMKNATDTMKESKVPDILNMMDSLAYQKLEFEEFCAAAISVYQLEVHEEWETIAKTAFEYFEQAGNGVISVEELAQEMNLGASSHTALVNWIRQSDGKLSFVGYTKFLHGVTIRSSNARQRPRQNLSLTSVIKFTFDLRSVRGNNVLTNVYDYIAIWSEKEELSKKRAMP
ncbi:CDPK-related kinase 6-like [Senna tora]|uniref:non-specific serine/threonine protein kinase n=1 Tax=Senna tora TaxID=362788 RepID=A0A834T7R8_9FABA|nr:CDPK-related kinase 6-like [Senna tora]